jgi:voltage-gated potassium channel
VKDHHVICGYGVKGRAAVRALLDDGVAAADIVVVEAAPGPLEEASRAGLTVVRGDSSRTATLNEARIALARTVIIATDRDDNAVLTTLTARELAPGARIIASVREEENRHLLEQSGADSVITSSETAGRLLGVTALHPQTAKVVEDLLDTAHGLRLVEREIGPEGPGPDTAGEVPVAVVRAGRLLRIDAVGCLPLRQGDLLVSLAGEAEPAR